MRKKYRLVVDSSHPEFRLPVIRLLAESGYLVLFGVEEDGKYFVARGSAYWEVEDKVELMEWLVEQGAHYFVEEMMKDL